MRILVVEDEQKLLYLLRDGLREHGHTVMTAAEGIDALALACEHPFDVIILDLMLPGMNGWQVMRELTRRENPASVLMLTACDAEPEVIEGLDAGADDYLTKPFSFRELLARINCLTRARSRQICNVVRIDTLVLEGARHLAFRSGQNLELTRTEFALLDCLIRAAGNTVTRSDLLHAVWGNEPSVSRSALDSSISLLRKKVDIPRERKLVHTIKGIGYSVRVEGDESQKTVEEHA